jgi:uncharacterized protein
MAIRFILLVVALWLLFSTVRWIKKQRNKAANQAPERHSVNMVACNRCGVHLPQDEAICQDGDYYCCDEHARLGKEKIDA